MDRSAGATDPPRALDPLEALGAMGFVGAGAVGATLARALAARGARVAVISARGPGRAAPLAAILPGCVYEPDAAAAVGKADLIWLAVPDDAIAGLDASLPWRAGQIVVHLSGARGVDALARAAACGARVAALHPLMTFAGPSSEADRFATDGPDAAGIPGAGAALARLARLTWALEAADEATAERMAALVRRLDGVTVRIGSADRAPYHIAAVLASNYVVTLLGAAIALWEGFGVSAETARAALLPLVRASVENVGLMGPARALTGPVARGDAGTVAAHVRWLAARAGAAGEGLRQADEHGGDVGSGESAPPAAGTLDPMALLAAYRDLARLAIPLAEARGSLLPEAAAALRMALAGDDMPGE